MRIIRHWPRFRGRGNTDTARNHINGNHPPTSAATTASFRGAQPFQKVRHDYPYMHETSVVMASC